MLKMLKSKKGQGMVEYALIIALVAVALIVIVGAMTGGIGNTFNTIKNAL